MVDALWADLLSEKEILESPTWQKTYSSMKNKAKGWENTFSLKTDLTSKPNWARPQYVGAMLSCSHIPDA